MSAGFHSSTSRPTTLEEAQALIAELRQQAQVQIAELRQKLQWSELQRSALEEQLRLKRIEKYGAVRGSRTYSWSCWRKNRASARRK